MSNSNAVQNGKFLLLCLSHFFFFLFVLTNCYFEAKSYRYRHQIDYILKKCSWTMGSCCFQWILKHSHMQKLNQAMSACDSELYVNIIWEEWLPSQPVHRETIEPIWQNYHFYECEGCPLESYVMLFFQKEVGHCEQQYALSKCIFVDLTKLCAYSAQMWSW